jgi:hypothetical protein
MTLYRLPTGGLVAVTLVPGRRPPLVTHVRLADGRVVAVVRSSGGSP